MISGFILKRPDKTRKTFQITPYRRVNGRKIYDKVITNPELDALNASLLSGTLNAAQVETEIKAKILPELKRKAKVPDKVVVESMVSDHNLKVFKAFWDKEYRRKRLENPAIAKGEFLTALRILEPLSLHTCDVDELQDHWDSKESGTRHKRYGNRINQLLRHLARGFEIQTDRAKVPPLKWVTWDELETILKHVTDDTLKDLYRSLYGTGARLGEMLALGPHDLRDNGSVVITKQIDRYRNAKPYTKNKHDHDAVILDEALDAVKRWVNVADKVSLRSRCQNPLIEAARKAYPHDKAKHISPHKLRHSYVKQMLSLGVPLERVAKMLGDRTSTLEQVYRQWTVDDAEVDYVRDIMRRGYTRLKR